MSNKYEQIETGIYRYKAKDDEITYHERPSINGNRTYRSLGVNFTKQTSLKLAREEYHRRKTELAAGKNPYAETKPAGQQPPPPPEKPTVSKIIIHYRDAGYPDRYLHGRTGKTLRGETDNCETLLEYWNGQPWDSLTPKSWDDYRKWRVANVKGSCTGDRSVDYEKTTLGNAFKYALRKELIDNNPVVKFPRFQPKSVVRHCREFKPENAEELHEVASLFLESGHAAEESLFWQMLYEANTGLRTEEALMLRTDAKAGQAGYVAEDGNLHVVRVKHGINPFVNIHSGLKKVIKAHMKWKAVRYPDSPWFFPGRDPSQPLSKGALSTALRRLRKKIGKVIKSHGMRAWYVLIRRSQNVSDEIIAYELGQKSGADIIVDVYGDIPPNWKNGGGPKLKWLPKKPAWLKLKLK